MPKLKTPEQKARAYAVLDHINAHPELHEQTTWMSKKEGGKIIGCFAGWTCLLAGDKPVFGHPFVTNRVVSSSSKRRCSIYGRARYLLGLTPKEEEELFQSHNTRNGLRNIVQRFYGERDVPS